MQTEEQSLHCTLVSEYYWVIDVPVHVNQKKNSHSQCNGIADKTTKIPKKDLLHKKL